MSSLPAGWYKDPADPTTQRYWDGEGWLGEAIPADATPPDGPPPVAPEPTAPPLGSAPATSAPTTGQPFPGPPHPPGAGFPPAQGFPPGQGLAPGQAPPPGWMPPPGWTPPPGWAPPAGWVPPPGWAPPPGWTPPPGQVPPAGWTPPPGQVPPAGWAPHTGQAPPQGWAPPGWTPPPGFPVAYAVQARPHGFELAGMGSRFMARLIDFIAVLLLNIVVNGYLGYQWWLEVEPIFRASMTDPFGTPQQPSTRSDYLMITMLFVATALWLAYEVPAIGNSGQTLGKRIMHIQVVALENTDRLGFGRAFRRWGRLGMWTPLWACYGLGLVVQIVDSVSPLFDQKLRQALHDKTARTVVIALPPGHRLPVGTAGDVSEGDVSKGEK